MKKLFKNTISVLLGAIVLSFALLGVGCLTAQEKGPDLEYKLVDNTYYEVTGIGSITDTDIVIPETYNELPVKTIAASAFKDGANLTSVEIGNSVTTIGASAFQSCANLTSVEIGNSVISAHMPLTAVRAWRA